jgi:hypothetical protein
MANVNNSWLIKVEAYLEEPTSQPPPQGFVGLYVIVTVTFAASTPPTGQSLQILVTALQGFTPTETVIDCKTISGSSSTTHTLQIPLVPDHVWPFSIAVYAWLGLVPGTDRAPNTNYYQITSYSVSNPDVFYDYEGEPVGGIVTPTNKLEILTPYLALAGLITLATVVVKKKVKVKL